MIKCVTYSISGAVQTWVGQFVQHFIEDKVFGWDGGFLHWFRRLSGRFFSRLSRCLDQKHDDFTYY